MSAETKTCSKCGKEKPLDGFHKSKRHRYGRYVHCRECVAKVKATKYYRDIEASRAQVRNSAARFKSRHAEEVREEQRAKFSRNQAVTTERATNHGKEWTGPELEIAADMSRTTTEVALTLGRTQAAVMAIRVAIRTDPRKARMAGTDVEPTS